MSAASARAASARAVASIRAASASLPLAASVIAKSVGSLPASARCPHPLASARHICLCTHVAHALSARLHPPAPRTPTRIRPHAPASARTHDASDRNMPFPRICLPVSIPARTPTACICPHARMPARTAVRQSCKPSSPHRSKLHSSPQLELRSPLKRARRRAA